MNASSTSAPSSAALRFAMSARTASRSWYLTGPMHAGISKSRSPMTRCMNSGNSIMSAGIPVSPPVAAEALEALLHVRRVADLAGLAVVDDGHAGVGLAAHDVGDRVADLRVEAVVLALAAVAPLERRGELGRPGQAAGVRRQDVLGRALHASLLWAGGCLGIQRSRPPGRKTSGAPAPDRAHGSVRRSCITRRRRRVSGCRRSAPRRIPSRCGEAQRPRVALVDDRHDRAQAEAVEAEVDAGARGLGRQAPPPPVRRQAPAHLDRREHGGQERRDRQPGEADAARAGLARDERPQAEAVLVPVADEAVEQFGALGRRQRPVRRHPAHDRRVGVQRDERVEVLRGTPWAQDQALGLDRRMDHGPEPSRMGLRDGVPTRPLNQGDAVPSHLRYRPPGRSAKGAPGSRWRASQPRGLALCGSVPRLGRTYSGAFGEVKDARRKRSANCGDSCDPAHRPVTFR